MGSLTWNTKNIPDLSGKCFIVTGGNSGVGYECAKELALHGAHVIIATHGQRPGGPSPADAVDGPGAVSKIKEAKSDANVEYMECDLASFRSIRSFVDSFKSRQLPLNGVINNAGLQTPPDAKTEDGFEITIGVNFYGPFYLTQLLLPSLKASTPSRVVWVSSPEETIAEPDWNDVRGTQFSTDIKSYACSKLWDLMAAIELNDRLNGTGVESFACHPGMCRTDLFRKGDHDKMATQITDWAQWLGGQTAASGALPLLYCATAPELQGKGGTYYGAYYKGPWTPNLFNTSQRTPGHSDANNQELRRKLYDEAVNICNEVAGGKKIQSKPIGAAAAADVSGPPVQIETLEEKKARGGEAWVATRKKSDSGSGAAGEGGAAGSGDGVTVESIEKAPGGLAWEAHSKRSGADESSQLLSGAAQAPAHPADTVADTAGKPVQVQNVEKAAGGLAWDAKPQGAAAGAAPASGAGGAGGVAAGIQGAVASGKEAISNLADKVSQGVASMGIGGDKTGEKRHVPYGQGISPADAPAGMTAE